MNTLRGASELYWQQNWLGYNDKINAQFYDPGRDRLAGAQALPSLMSLRAKKPFEGRREVLVVDSDEDFEFRRFVDSVYELIVLVPTQHARILMAARLVAERLGGPGVTQGKTMYHSRDSVVCHIGNISKGVCRTLLTERIQGDPRREWIARGGFAEVYKVLLTDDIEIALKEIKLPGEAAEAERVRKEYKHEAQNFSRLRHKNIAEANVMLKNGEAKMVDFGLATPIASTHTSPQGKAYEHLGLTRHFAAPERFVQLPDSYGKQDTIGVKADVYSFGLLLYFLWSCQEPWQAELNSFGWTQELQRRIVEEGERPRLPNTMPQEVAEVVEATLKHSSRDRPTMKEVAATLQQLHHDAVRDQSRRHLLGCKTNFGPSGAAQSHTAVQQPNK
ncbi:hypothetical protein WJX84_011354 [Apatococcus fuscideae]|uniref:Protein kinase domain-containing protein n=1 Tax=Apatococcus fuscideae TaxID=2026836 RepID=A0AAW1ST12_9CHLO